MNNRARMKARAGRMLRGDGMTCKRFAESLSGLAQFGTCMEELAEAFRMLGRNMDIIRAVNEGIEV